MEADQMGKKSQKKAYNIFQLDNFNTHYLHLSKERGNKRMEHNKSIQVYNLTRLDTYMKTTRCVTYIQLLSHRNEMCDSNIFTQCSQLS